MIRGRLQIARGRANRCWQRIDQQRENADILKSLRILGLRLVERKNWIMEKEMKKALWIFLPLLVFAVTIATAPSIEAGVATGTPPQADAGASQTVDPGDHVSLDGSGSSDPDGSIEAYAWTQTGGPSVSLSGSNTATPSFTAPNAGPGGADLTFKLIVTDNNGLIDDDTVVVTVNGVPNLGPTANAGTDKTVNPGDTVTLDSSGSSDPDDGIASRKWEQTGGPSVSLSSSSATKVTFTAPDAGVAGTTLTFQLTVTDFSGSKDTDTCRVTVRGTTPPTEDPPIIDPTPAIDPITYTAWWYDPVQTGGNGIAIEVQSGIPGEYALYLGWYSYDEAGNPIWYTSGNLMSSPTAYSGALRQWTGWPLGGPVGPFQSEAVGTVDITFISEDEAQITWTLSSGGTGTKTFHRFMDDIAPGVEDSRSLTGWWMDPQQNGVGVFIEAQGGGIYMAWYFYGEGGGPHWWASGNVFTESDTTYEGAFDEWKNGQCLCGPPAVPEGPAHPGNVTVEFLGSSNATLTWTGGQLNLQRFEFWNLNVEP